MALIVQKYGGSSVADTESIKRVAKRVVETEKKGNKVAVVVSAMGDTTDDLIDQALSIDSNPPEREMDMLMTAGERISMSLLAMAINAKGDATTLGRGGSDTSAVALAVALGADICEIYTDVDGIFTADPRIVPSARRIPSIDYESILEMASCGSKVLALRCVEYAQRFNMPLHVRSSFSRRPGTLVVPDGIDPRTLPNLD